MGSDDVVRRQQLPAYEASHRGLTHRAAADDRNRFVIEGHVILRISIAD
jgi:hypothetical protein